MTCSQHVTSSVLTCALISQFSDPVEDDVYNFLADGVVSSCVVVGGVLLAGDQLFRVEQLTVGSRPHLI